MGTPSPPAEKPEPVKEAQPEIKRPDVVVGSITITIPFAWGSPGYVSRRVQVPRLTARQSSALRAIQNGLGENGDTLKNGRPVANASHSVQKLLDDIADAIEKASA